MGVRPNGRIMSNKCKVCGYGMPHPPKPYNICPCCGVEYGVDDAFESPSELRERWLEAGAPWFSDVTPHAKPQPWDLYEQLLGIGYLRQPETSSAELANARPFECSSGVGAFARMGAKRSGAVVVSFGEFKMRVPLAPNLGFRLVQQKACQATPLRGFVEESLLQRRPPSSELQTLLQRIAVASQ